MRYLPPFDVLKSFVAIESVDGELMVKCPYESLVELLRKILVGIEVDEKWYLTRYEDIADAISKGVVTSARDHFVNDGYFEGRWPFPIEVDEEYYLENNPGVADYVQRGLLTSGQQHFEENGYQEGRLPFGL